MLDYRIDDPTRRYLVYSKNIKDNLPLTTTTLDTRPCINPTQTSSLSKFYPTEIERTEICLDDNGEFLYDPRFKPVGESITEFELEEENGVL